MKKSRKQEDDAAVVRAARDLHGTMERIERLTERIGELRVTSRTKLSSAGELLEQAAQRHRDFLSGLGALIGEINSLRERQNASAATLADLAERMDERRKVVEALEQRFADLGQDTQAITAALHGASGSNGEAGEAGDRLRAVLPAIRDKLAAAVDAAAALTSDARAAELKDLAEQAHAVSQQLEALARKLESAPGRPN